MTDFLFYVREGIQHITDLQGIDHMVFVTTLCAVFSLEQWRRVLILVTAFTIGHSATLLLSSLNLIAINQTLIEFLIPVTILLTSLCNVFTRKATSKGLGYNYLLAAVFGLIHGMGFSNFFKAMMVGMTDGPMLMPLFAFNVGIEMGQMVIVSLFMFLYWMVKMLFSAPHANWNLHVSGAGGGIALMMIVHAITGT